MTQQHSPDLERRFGGLARLYGAEGAARIRAARVAVVGIGGVGSWAAEALARSGVGAITLVDLDNVAESNVNRQIHALTSTLGQPKVEAMRQRIALIHPGCEVHCVEDFAAPGNWPALLPAAVDGVIDACDQVHAKQALAAWALKTRALFITCGAAGGKRQGERVEIADLAEVTHDPLMAALRARLRQTGSMVLHSLTSGLGGVMSHFLGFIHGVMGSFFGVLGGVLGILRGLAGSLGGFAGGVLGGFAYGLAHVGGGIAHLLGSLAHAGRLAGLFLLDGVCGRTSGRRFILAAGGQHGGSGQGRQNERFIEGLVHFVNLHESRILET